MRLIDADAAIEAFGLSEKTRKYGGDHSGYNTMMLYEIQNVLDDLPTIEQPQTGHWKPIEDSDWWRGYVCDKCGKAVNQRENFCPNCGARMVTE